MDIEALRDWIGRPETAEDVVTPRLIERFLATLGPGEHRVRVGDRAPAGIHWCLAPRSATRDQIGEDGHPALGAFMPPVPLPRRMWASGSLAYYEDILVGDTVHRASRVANVELKRGRTGQLCFVTVEHDIATPRGTAIKEVQSIVYREPSPAPSAARPAESGSSGTHLIADEIMLFRYSALTFNAHRIHYDLPYATVIEGYPGLVVHAPLQATLLLRHAEKLGQQITAFSFRSVAPLFCGEAFRVEEEAGGKLFVRRADGDTTMTADVRW